MQFNFQKMFQTIPWLPNPFDSLLHNYIVFYFLFLLTFLHLVSSNNKNVPEWSSLEVLFLCIKEMARWTDLLAFSWLHFDGKFFFFLTVTVKTKIW